MDVTRMTNDEVASWLATEDPATVVRVLKCAQQEAATYRRAVVTLVSEATSGDRKTLDKAHVADVAGQALEEGNAWSLRATGR